MEKRNQATWSLRTAEASYRGPASARARYQVKAAFMSWWRLRRPGGHCRGRHHTEERPGGESGLVMFPGSL